MGKLRASTLIEVIVSLVIISTITTIGLMTYVNIIKSDDITRKTEASIKSLNIANQIKNERLFIDDLITENEITYEISFSNYDNKKALSLMEIIASTNNGKRLYKYSEILINE